MRRNLHFLVGGLATCAIHALAIALLHWEMRPNHRSASALAPPLRARFIDDHDQQRIDAIPAFAFEVSERALRGTPPDLPSPPLAFDSIEESRVPSDIADSNTLETLQTIYREQIFARLARVLELRDTEQLDLGDSCTINIIQDARGMVLDVATDLCPVRPEVAASLVSLVREASPLPLPPAGLAMGTYLALDLSAAFGTYPSR